MSHPPCFDLHDHLLARLRVIQRSLGDHNIPCNSTIIGDHHEEVFTLLQRPHKVRPAPLDDARDLSFRLIPLFLLPGWLRKQGNLHRISVDGHAAKPGRDKDLLIRPFHGDEPETLFRHGEFADDKSYSSAMAEPVQGCPKSLPFLFGLQAQTAFQFALLKQLVRVAGKKRENFF